eukprot:362984-Chlamydomonas_euryale.AAC.8
MSHQQFDIAGMGGRAIPGNIPEIEALELRCSGRYLIVIEKVQAQHRFSVVGMYATTSIYEHFA